MTIYTEDIVINLDSEAKVYIVEDGEKYTLEEYIKHIIYWNLQCILSGGSD